MLTRRCPSFRWLLLCLAVPLLTGLLLSADRLAGQPPKPNGKQKPQPAAAVADTLPAGWVKQLSWRCIGPATMGGRIVAFAVFEADPTTYWVATASGGLLKTTNNGVTFEHQFDRETTVSIGDVAVAPSDRNVVWVGTGENNPRNSVSYGDGVYKSTDGGKSWKHMGLNKTFQIGRLAIHPTNPNIVYVGALGRLYGPSEERGLYKTSDGGKTWDKVFYLDDRTGIIDIRMSPSDPETLLVAAWERRRDEFDSHPGPVPLQDGHDGYDPVVKWGARAGIYKTTDGGKSWKKMTKGLPTCKLGRIGLDYYRKDPLTVFAIVDSEKVGMGAPPNPVFLGVQGTSVKGGAKLTRITPKGPADKAGLMMNDVITFIAGKPVKSYDDLLAAVLARKPGDKMPLTVLRSTEARELTVVLGTRPEEQGGRPGRVYIGLFGTDTPKGIKVTQVANGSPAEKAKLRAGDLVTAANKKPVTSLRQLAAATAGLKSGDRLALTLVRDNKAQEVVVTVQPRQRGGRSPNRPWAAFLSGQRENAQDRQGPVGFQTGGVYKSTDGGESWKRVNSLNPRPMYFSQVRVDPSDDSRVYVLGVALYRSADGGKTFKPDGGNGIHADQHALWIDPRDGRHALVGTDGGFYVSRDRMTHWEFLNVNAIGQFYHVCTDTRQPYHVYGGLQDNASWGGPSRSLRNGILNEDWIVVSGGDGFVCQVERDDPDIVYSESQNGNMHRRDLRTGRQVSIRPRGQRGQSQYRFNWNTPFLLSRHNPRIFYCAGNVVFRSLERGQDLRAISPDITRSKRGSGSALAESPLDADVLYAGSDDGNVWVTRDGGKNWSNVTEKLLATEGAPKGPRWVASIEASRFAAGRAYVVLDAHRSNDDAPYVFVTEDYGQKWKSLRANLPWGSTRVLREDAGNANLLYLGTEFALWASINRGESWTKINNNLPTVAVHEIAVHPTAGEIVAATHGRSLWILDVSALRQVKPSLLTEKVVLFKPQTATRWRSLPARGPVLGPGSHRFVGQDPPSGAQIYYALRQKAKSVKLKVVDFKGATVRELKAAAEPGLHRVSWDLTRFAFRVGPGRQPFSEPAPPGMYRVVLTVDGAEFTRDVRVERDPTLPEVIPVEVPQPREGRKINSVDD